MAAISTTLHDVSKISFTEPKVLPSGRTYQDIQITFDNGSQFETAMFLAEGFGGMPATEVKA
jgi:hypothetical protein